MSTQGIAPGLACHPSAWGDRDCDLEMHDSCMVVHARIGSCEPDLRIRAFNEAHPTVRGTKTFRVFFIYFYK